MLKRKDIFQSGIIVRPARPEDQTASRNVENTVWHPVLRCSRGLPPYRFEPDLHVVAEHPENGIVATADACLMDWDGDPDTLPQGGWLETYKKSQDPETAQKGKWACVLGTSILPGYQGSGLAQRMLEGIRVQVEKAGLLGSVAPARPTHRHLMPHLSISDYAQIKLPDGRSFDPWIRLHEKIGGEVIGTTEQSVRLWATREELENWLEMKLPEAGSRIACPGTIGWLEMDEDRGYVSEDSVWIIHRPRENEYSDPVEQVKGIPLG